ncbi:MAG: hypothetical protein J2P46_17890, partial [Zavarzinella sp.]|nr:hypothetical protein [Zavarzinella sp.]
MRFGHRLRARFALLLAAALPVGSASAFPKVPAVDRHGDPLPAGAVGRLGTVQLRAGCDTLTFSADGKTLIGTSGRLLRVWDAAAGRLVETRLLPDIDRIRRDRTEDGRTLVVNRQTGIELWDLATGKPLTGRWPAGRKNIWTCFVANDCRWILFADTVSERDSPIRGFNPKELVQHLVLWDATTGKGRTLSEDETGIVSLAISPDGRRAVSTGGKTTRVWDTTSGKLRWEVPGYNAEQCHFTLDGKHLIAAPGGGQSAWHAWDADTGKPSKTLRPPTVGYAWTFAISPDGNLLLIPTETDYVIWDLKAGEVRHRWPGANQSGRGTFAPDGKSVVTYDTILRRWDLATGKNLYADVSVLGHTAPVRRMFFNPDGTRLVSIADDQTARVWDVPTTKPLRTIRIEAPTIDAWAVSPDGGTLIGVDERLVAHRWPLASDGARVTAHLRDAQQLDIGLRARDVRVGPDGTLALLAWPRGAEYAYRRYSFSFWDLTTGRLVRWGGDPGREYSGDSARLSVDGRLAANTEAVFDTITGKGYSVPTSPGPVATRVLSSDGRLVAAAGMRVLELATGRALIDLPLQPDATDIAAFSPDGRRLAGAGGDRLIVWDVGSRTAVAEWAIPPLSGSVAFSPDGRTVATGHSDGTILLWRVPAPAIEGRWSAGEGAALWEDLGDEIPGNAWTAVWQLADHPADAVRLLRGKYPLAPVPAAEDIAKLIAALDSPKFAEREAASKRLAELGRAAERLLRQALRASPSPEQA